MRVLALLIVFLSALPWSAFAASFASQVVSYTPGSNTAAGYGDPNTALGSPGRTTGSGAFDGDVTPFNAPYAASDVVSIGAGGSLVVRFDHQVTDDAANPYGIDLLVFGNSFLGIDFGTGLADGTLIFTEPGLISVSQDGSTWFDVPGLFADGSLFPTLAYQDPTGPFSFGGTIPTSYTQVVNPALTAADFAGLTTAQIAALYGGSGGGTGIDLAVARPAVDRVRAGVAARERRLVHGGRRVRRRAGASCCNAVRCCRPAPHLVSSANTPSHSGGGGFRASSASRLSRTRAGPSSGALARSSSRAARAAAKSRARYAPSARS